MSAIVTVSVSGSLFEGRPWIMTLTDQVQGWKHTIGAFGGFLSASFTVGARRREIEDWWEYGLGRHIEAYDSTGSLIWEGFVNQISVNMGAYQLTQGPVTDITNQLTGYYQALTQNSDGAVTESQERSETPQIPAIDGTTIAEQRALKSQSRYGIWGRKLSLGKTFEADAEQLALSFLREHCLPEINGGNFALSRAGDNTISIECLGYGTYLTAYTYHCDDTDYVTLSTKVKAILTADPNNVLSRDFHLIDENLSITNANEVEDPRAESLIKGITTMGDSIDRRWLFGIYENRLPYYQPVLNHVHYTTFLHDPSQRILLVDGPEEKPWNVRPGRWLLFADLVPMAGHDLHNPQDDIAAMFIESVSYTAPAQLEMTGAKISTLAQKLQRLGLGGVSA